MCVSGQLITFGAHECSFGGFAAIAAALIKGEALLPGPSHHLSVVWQQAPSGQWANAVNSAGVGVWDEQSSCDRVHCQEVFMGWIIAAVTEKKKSRLLYFLKRVPGIIVAKCGLTKTLCFIIRGILPVSEIFVPSRGGGKWDKSRAKQMLIHTVCGAQPTESNTKLSVVWTAKFKKCCENAPEEQYLEQFLILLLSCHPQGLTLFFLFNGGYKPYVLYTDNIIFSFSTFFISRT